MRLLPFSVSPGRGVLFFLRLLLPKRVLLVLVFPGLALFLFVHKIPVLLNWLVVLR